MKLIKHNKKGFALIYVMLVVVFLGVTVFAVWATGMSDTRLSRKTEYSTQAMILANSAAEDAFQLYLAKMKTSFSSRADWDASVPDNACSSNAWKVKYSNGTSYQTDQVPNINNLFTPGSSWQQRLKDGFYAYRICANGTEPGKDTSDYIEGYGFYQNSKYRITAQISHLKDRWKCTFVEVIPDNLETQTEYEYKEILHDYYGPNYWGPDTEQEYSGPYIAEGVTACTFYHDSDTVNFQQKKL